MNTVLFLYNLNYSSFWPVLNKIKQIQDILLNIILQANLFNCEVGPIQLIISQLIYLSSSVLSASRDIRNDKYFKLIKVQTHSKHIHSKRQTAEGVEIDIL